MAARLGCIASLGKISCFLLGPFCASAALAQGPAYPNLVPVASFQLGAPDESEFILRGTLPLPDTGNTGLDYRLQIRDAAAMLHPAQVEVVSRYPDGTLGPDVIELLARVPRPAGVNPGTPISYDVVINTYTPPAFQLTQSVASLIQGGIELSTSDVFSHVYTSNPFGDIVSSAPELQVRRDGHIAKQYRTHDWMLPGSGVPLGPPDGALPHMFGVHAYVTQFDSEDFIALDLRIHNGGVKGLHASSSQVDPLGKVYFDGLKLKVPCGWKVLQAFADPFFLTTPVLTDGTYNWWALVDELPGNMLHVMPARGQFVRRLALVRDDAGIDLIRRAKSALDEKWLGFCRRGPGQDNTFLSWWNPETARYFAQNEQHPHPGHYDLGAMSTFLDGELAKYEGDLANGYGYHNGNGQGSTDLLRNVMGWFHALGSTDGAMAGGTYIFFWEGVDTALTASRSGYRLLQLHHRTTICREPIALYDAEGIAMSPEDWTDTTGANWDFMPVILGNNFKVPTNVNMDPFGLFNTPSYQRNAVARAGWQPTFGLIPGSNPPQELDETHLLEYSPHYNSHMIRNTRTQKALAWLGNDALAKDDLRMQAELVRMLFSMLPQVYGDPLDPNTQASAIGMLRKRRYVNTYPGWGVDVCRAEGWMADTVAAAYALGDDGLRTRIIPWANDVTDLLYDAQIPCFGTVMAMIPANPYHMPLIYRGRQGLSVGIISNGLWGLRSSVLDGRDPLRSAMAYSLLSNESQALIDPDSWDAAPANGDPPSPHFWLAIGDANSATPPYCVSGLPIPRDGHSPSHELTDCWSMLAYGHRLLSATTFLDHAKDMSGGTIASLIAALQSDNHYDFNVRIPLIIQLEQNPGYLGLPSFP